MHSCIWDDNIKMDLKEVGCGDVMMWSRSNWLGTESDDLL
jgi:hypothetical protein